ncbi:MAG TPA: aminoglycoside adenylyltransferase domain-containing protein [Gaiellaceae bacterium]|nr:aminoglycoside adenylyltransferase domain-containing protein [Gaiellaceae bacterium]
MTEFPELDELLARFTADVEAELGDDLAGLYLQGSFALGEGDEWSDVDFVCVTREAIEPGRLQPLHGRLYDLPTPWAQHLEGSYLPAALIRRVDPEATPVPFLDNGARELVLDPHCNTALVRWLLREHGRALSGPPARELIDPVDPAELRAEAEAKLADYAAWAPEGTMTRWKQPYLVLTFCRILRTIACGDVTSKRVAADWALDTLGERWRPLIRAALADRPNRWDHASEPADPHLAAETVAFAASVSRR